MRRHLITLFLFFICAGSGYCQLQKQINDNRKNLQKLKDDIRQYENRLSSEALKEKSEIERLNDINQKVGLLQQLRGELEQGRRLTEKNIERLREVLSQTRGELQSLKALTAQRLVQTYKHRDEDILAYILTAESWTQAYARMKYLKLIAEQDRRDLQNLRGKKEKIEIQKKQIEAELANQQFLIGEKKREKGNLDNELSRRRQALGKIRKDKKLLNALIEQRKEDLSTLQQLIVELERKKRQQEEELARQKALAATNPKSKEVYKTPEYVEKSTFSLYRGKLPYPVAGKIVKKFGDQYNAALGTTTRNPGVDIQSTEGAQVHSVAKGKVSLVTWLRRLGNTAIIDHGGGYYTVYAHLSEVYVNPDQPVASGETIANLDESDEGKAILHFEIYKDHDEQDPSVWLK